MTSSLTPEQTSSLDKSFGYQPSPTQHLSPLMQRLTGVASGVSSSDNSQPSAQTAADSLNAPPSKPGLLSRMASDTGNTLKKVTTDIGEAVTGKDTIHGIPTGMTSGPTRVAGDLAKGAMDLTSEPIKSLWSMLPPTLQSHVKENIKNLVGGQENTDKIKQILGKTVQAYQDFSAKHPQATRDLESLGNIAMAGAGGEGAGQVADVVGDVGLGAVGKVVGKDLIESGVKSGAGTAAKDAVVEMVSPVLSKSESIAAREAGRETPATMFKSAVMKPAAKDIERANVVKDIVNPKSDINTNIAAVRNQRAVEAQNTIEHLKQNDVPFTKATLNKNLSSIEKSPLLASEARLNDAYNIAKDKFMQFVSEQPKKLSGLLQARKDFDVWVNNAFPNLYSDQSLSPLKQALKDMRNAGNDFIESKLPENSPFKNQLRKQHLMFEATENMAEKGEKIKNLSKIGQAMKKYPKTAKAAKTAATLIIGGEAVKHLAP